MHDYSFIKNEFRDFFQQSFNAFNNHKKGNLPNKLSYMLAYICSKYKRFVTFRLLPSKSSSIDLKKFKRMLDFTDKKLNFNET